MLTSSLTCARFVLCSQWLLATLKPFSLLGFILTQSFQELSLRLCAILSIEDPAYMTELHEAAALLFSLTLSLNCRPTSPTFDFYIKVRKVDN